APRPEPERLIGAHAQTDAVYHPRAGAAPSQIWILEEGGGGAGASFLVGVEEVVDGGIVLVDRLLDQAHAHDAGVEEQVVRGVGRDRAYVVDAVQWFHISPVSYLAGTGIIPARVCPSGGVRRRRHAVAQRDAVPRHGRRVPRAAEASRSC